MNKNRLSYFPIFCLLFLFIFLRIIFLDADLPLGDISGYSKIDELYYTIGGFNLFHYSQYLNPEIPYTETDAGPFNICHDIFTALSLHIFKNNFYGLRMASVMCSILIFLLILKIIKVRQVLTPVYQHSIENYKLIVIAFLLLLCCDYSFLLASRVSEPGIFRSFSLVIMILIFSIDRQPNKKSDVLFAFFIGFLATATVCFVYLYNAFIIGASAIALFLICLKEKNKLNLITNGIGFLIGAITACVLYEVFISVNFNKSFVDYWNILNSYSGRVEVSSDNFIKKAATSFIKNASSNMFKLNLPFLFLTLISLPLFIYRVIKDKLNRDIFILCLIAFWFLQSLFENSFYEKRHVIMYPVFLLMIIFASASLFEFRAVIKNRSRIIGLSVYFLLAIVTITFIFKASYYHFKSVDPGLLFFLKLNGLAFLLMLIGLSIYLFYQKSRKIITFFMLLALLSPGLYLTSNMIFNRTYNYKNALISMSPHLNNNVVAGSISYAFRLYNTSIPVLNRYAWQHNLNEYQARLKKLFKEHANYTVMYTPENFINISPSLHSVSKGEKFIFTPVGNYNIGFKNVTLYKKTDK